MEEKREKKFRIIVKGLLVLALIVLGNIFLNIKSADAAALYFSPKSGTYTVGKYFSVSVNVSTGDSAANAFQGTINFPADKLQLTSIISKSGSIMSLWVEEPSFSNSDGTAHFAGVVLNPGFTGPSGKIITLNFKVKSAGKAHLGFSDGAVLANDGQGTNILSGFGAADFILNKISEAPAPLPEPGGVIAPIKSAVKAAALSLLTFCVVSFLSPLAIISLLFFAILFLLWYVWHKSNAFRRKLLLTLKGTEEDVHKAFDMLRESVRQRIIFLEKLKTKRELTLEEEKIMKQMRSDLDTVEKTIKKEIQDIEKKL